jgi:hypothetical protein
MLGFEIATFEESCGVLFDEADKFLAGFPYVKDVLKVSFVFPDKIRFVDETRDLLLFQGVVAATEGNALGQASTEETSRMNTISGSTPTSLVARA